MALRSSSKAGEVRFCGYCANGHHARCYSTEAHPCACADDFHRPGLPLCGAMARYRRPDLTPDQAGDLARAIFEEARA